MKQKIEVGQVWQCNDTKLHRSVICVTQVEYTIYLGGSKSVCYTKKYLLDNHTLYRHADGTLASPEPDSKPAEYSQRDKAAYWMGANSGIRKEASDEDLDLKAHTLPPPDTRTEYIADPEAALIQMQLDKDKAIKRLESELKTHEKDGLRLVRLAKDNQIAIANKNAALEENKGLIKILKVREISVKTLEAENKEYRRRITSLYTWAINPCSLPENRRIIFDAWVKSDGTAKRIDEI